MRILISNDDGIYSPGLACLAKAASEFGAVRVVAPDVERSSTGHAITSSRPLSYRPTTVHEFEAYRVNGTPADCVALGAHLWERVDVVLSGVNLGLNLGHAIWHSGTLAAAKQAALLGLRGIAISAPAGVEPDHGSYGRWIRRVLEVLLPASQLSLVNVNLPRSPKGLVWTRASVTQYDGRIAPAQDPMGRPIYWFTVSPLDEAEKGTDRWAVEQGWVSLTPLRLDLTDELRLDERRKVQPLDEAVAAAVSPPVSSPEAKATVREDEAESPAVAPGHD
ncbi:MAG: 5'/3'-nucleotidase SurE [Acidobacteria bacterium]|nr:5'/3'-nucleotidase SurE [Acidobacteriota bacterium]